MSTMRPPLTTSMTGPLTTPSDSLIFSIVPQARSYWARFLERTRRPSLSSFWRTRASTGRPGETISDGIDVVADGQLTDRDDALGLEADVEQDLVPVDLDHRPLDDVAVVELDDGAVHGVFEGGPAEVVLGDGRGMYYPVLVEGPMASPDRRAVPLRRCSSPVTAVRRT